MISPATKDKVAGVPARRPEIACIEEATPQYLVLTLAARYQIGRGFSRLLGPGPGLEQAPLCSRLRYSSHLEMPQA
jgi:hypothetical protein